MQGEGSRLHCPDRIASIGVGTGGARGGPAPLIYKSGGAHPPNVGAIKGILTVKMDFLYHFCKKNFFAQVQILTSKISVMLLHT